MAPRTRTTTRAKTIFSHGKHIEVVEIVPSKRKRGPRINKDGFALVPLEWAAEVAKAAPKIPVMLLVLLAYSAWREKGPTFALTSDLTRQYGVSRWAKARALAKLEAAGKIKVERPQNQAPIITLIDSPW
jgi:hypothetical protein